VRIQVNGQREGNNNYQIEGISATDYNIGELATTPVPSPDALEEFKVQTSMYDASEGRNGGGSINAILKSGSNEWHFDIFEFFRNDVMPMNTSSKRRGSRELQLSKTFLVVAREDP
jgi:hypothetical protein